MARPGSEDGERRCPWHDTHIENFGKNGKNGRLGNVIGEVKGLKHDMKKLKAELTAQHIRLAAVAGTGSIAGGGIIVGLIKIFS